MINIPNRPFKAHYYFYVSSSLVLILDQISKFIAVHNLSPYRSVEIVKGFINLTFVKNTGAAFGLFAGSSIPLALIGLLVSLMVIFFHFKTMDEVSLKVPLGLILGGSLGNLIDRVSRGYVIDFIDLRFWPAFNIADMAVNLGIVLILVRLILTKEKS